MLCPLPQKKTEHHAQTIQGKATAITEPFPRVHFCFGVFFLGGLFCFSLLNIFKSKRNGKKTANGNSVIEKTGFISKHLNHLRRKAGYKLTKVSNALK